MVLAFALAELLARSGERVGWLGLTDPILSRNSADRLAEALIQAEPQTSFPQRPKMGNHSDVVIFSDFLDPVPEITEHWRSIQKLGARGHVVQIIDPAEEVFPFSGRVEFNDPESGEKFTSGNAVALKAGYESEIAVRKTAFRQAANALDWSFIRHHTDRLASQALVALHHNLGRRSER